MTARIEPERGLQKPLPIETSRPVSRLGFLVLSVFIFTGCTSDSSPETFPVRGMVQLADGMKLRDGLVEFEIIGAKKLVTARGKIGPDGIFHLRTFKDRDGAFPGQHRVVVIANYQIGSGAERPGEIPKEKINPKYNDFTTSGLVIEVKRQDNEVVIELE